MSLTAQFLILIFVCYIIARSGSDKSQRKTDARSRKKGEKEFQQRLLNQRLREADNKARDYWRR